MKYGFDGQLCLISLRERGTSQNFIKDGRLTRQYHNLLERREGDKRVSYTWDDRVIRATGTEGSHYYLQDELGSPIRLLDQAGAGMETYGYDEFGNGLYQTEGMQPFTYTDYQADRIAGTYYAQARDDKGLP